MATGDPQQLRTRIEPAHGWFNFGLREMWNCRELAYLFARRDVLVIYKQTILGPAWFLIQPVLTSVVFAVIFGHVAKIGTDGIPHFLFYLTGVLMWNYFRGIMAGTAQSLSSIAAMASKIYFPRLLIPLSFPLSNLVYFFWNFLILAAFWLYYAVVRGVVLVPSWTVLLLPLLLLYIAVAALAAGLVLSALTVKYRDLAFTLPFIEQIWFYATPIVYPMSGVVHPVFKAVLLLNPMSQAVEIGRVMFLGAPAACVTLTGVLTGLCVTLVWFVIGLALFNRAQRTFVDVI